MINEEVQQGRILVRAAELPDVLAAAPGSMLPRNIEFCVARASMRKISRGRGISIQAGKGAATAMGGGDRVCPVSLNPEKT